MTDSDPGEIRECEACGYRTFYSTRLCPDCGSDRFDTRPAGTGELTAVTTVHVTPPGVREPNRLGVARFDGVGYIGQIEGEATPGDAVCLVDGFDLRETDEGTYSGPRIVAVEE